MANTLRLLADQAIPLPEMERTRKVSITRYNATEGIPEEVDEYDALFVRTVSRVDQTTIPSNPKNLRFIGSATAGIDHVDPQWLSECGIDFAYSPGCNARSVGEYVATVILIWSELTKTDLTSIQAGVIGAGHAGTRVVDFLEQLNISHVIYDPPKEARDPTFTGASLDEILGCDLLTFHTPLTKSSPWPTEHWLDREKLRQNDFRLIINTARGGVIDEQELCLASQKGSVGNYILDVWESEPVFHDPSARNSILATPHIAGYSRQAKQRGSRMILKAMFSVFGETFPEGLEDEARSAPVIPASELQPDLLRMLYRLNPVGEYHRRFKALIGMKPEDKSRQFQKIRSTYPLRDEHSVCRLDPALLEAYPVLQALGFRSA